MSSKERERMQRQEGARSKWLMGKGNRAGRKKERVGKTSERKLLRNELQTEGGVQRGDPGDRGRTQREGVKERTEKDGLIVNGRVVLKNPEIYVGINERKGVCVYVRKREERAQTRRTRFLRP